MKSIFNLFGYKTEKLYPIYLQKEDYKDHMESLFLKNKGNFHYVYIETYNTKFTTFLYQLFTAF